MADPYGPRSNQIGTREHAASLKNPGHINYVPKKTYTAPKSNTPIWTAPSTYVPRSNTRDTYVPSDTPSEGSRPSTGSSFGKVVLFLIAGFFVLVYLGGQSSSDSSTSTRSQPQVDTHNTLVEGHSQRESPVYPTTTPVAPPQQTTPLRALTHSYQVDSILSDMNIASGYSTRLDGGGKRLFFENAVDGRSYQIAYQLDDLNLPGTTYTEKDYIIPCKTKACVSEFDRSPETDTFHLKQSYRTLTLPLRAEQWRNKQFLDDISKLQGMMQ